MSTPFENDDRAIEGDAALETKPSFYDLEDHAEAGLVKRGLARYLITQDYERSIKWHRRLGTPIIKRLVVHTANRDLEPGSGNDQGNYRLNRHRSPLEAVTNFALRGSVKNELVHTVVSIPTSAIAVYGMVEGVNRWLLGAETLATGLNMAMVPLQRYNRARMIRVADRLLQRGEEFRPDYENWAGIDSRAMDNYRASWAELSPESPVPAISAEALPGIES